MYYWTRTGSWIDIASFMLLCALWAAGGVLIINHSFRAKVTERLITGLAAGFLLFVVLSNLLAQLVSLTIAYWSAAFLLFLTGILLTWFSRKKLPFNLIKSWPHLVLLALIIFGFTIILRGLAIFDDYYHLPMISVMATGDIPPHFYLNPMLHLPYHYGLQIFAASMVRLGGFFPWSAWDISRAIVFGFTVILAWLWIHRLTGSKLPAYLGSGLLVFGGATRWLLLFIPPQVLNKMGANLQMDISGLTAGGSLLTTLTNRWPMDGGGPFPFPYAFASGILEPLNMQLGATGVMWEMTILLLLLLWRPGKFSPVAAITTSLLLASLALSAEHVYAVVVGGFFIIFVALALHAFVRKKRAGLKNYLVWGIPLIFSAIIATFQGGYITGGIMNVLAKLTGTSYPMVTTDFQEFSLRWPPAVPSGHFGPLSLFDPGQIVIMLAEAGPALLLLPIIVIYWLRKRNKTMRLAQGIAAGAVVSFAFPIFFRYGLDFDITRLVGSALWISYALAFPIIWLWLKSAWHGYRYIAGIGYGVAIYAGVVMLAIEFIAIPLTQTTYYLKFTESDISRRYWNQLEPGAEILDSIPERAVLLFGRASFAANDVYKRSPEWEQLIADPDPINIAEHGYTYVYMDKNWWQSLSPDIQTTFSLPCVQLITQLTLPGNDFRNLYRVADCHP